MTAPAPATTRAAEQRGRTAIADRALARIAAHALTEVADVGGTARRMLGVPLGQDRLEAPPRVEAHVDGRLATLRLAVTVVYPSPVRQVVGRLRDHVTARVGALTGLDVRQVDVDVIRLVPPASARRRVT